MPVYELSLVLKSLPRAELATTLKRIGCFLIEKGAQIQKLENHGIDKELPYRFHERDQDFFKGSYFVYSFMSSPKLFADIIDECARDVDVIKHRINPTFYLEDLPHDCTLHEEMNPPALRKSVQDLFKISKKNKDKTKPFYWHVKHHNFYDPLM